MTYVLSVDLGSSAVKTALFDAQGKRLALAIEEYALLTPGPAMCEVPSEVFWEKFKIGARKVLEQSGIAPEAIAAISFSSQAETFVPVDHEGKPLRNAIFWLDNRAEAESREIENALGRKLVYEKTGQPVICPTWPATKILWLKHHEPDTFRKAHKYLLAEDYLIYRLTGRCVSEYSIYSSSLLLDITKHAYWKDMLDLLDVSEDQFPELRESGTAVGKLDPKAADETGLSRDTLVVTGSYDHAAGSIGSGTIHAGMLSETTGSSMALCAPVDRPTYDPHYRAPCHCHSLKGMYFLTPWGETAGLVLKWFRDVFCAEEIRMAESAGKSAFELMSKLSEQIPAGSEGRILLPYLSGAGCPEYDPRARGVFFGMEMKHTKAHFIRAIMEAIAFMLKRNVEIVEAAGIPVEEVRLLGGGARSGVWCQIKADVLQKPVVTFQEQEQALLGAAILAGLGAGLHSDIESAVRNAVRPGKTFLPNRDNAGIYSVGCEKYKKLYETLKPLF